MRMTASHSRFRPHWVDSRRRGPAPEHGLVSQSKAAGLSELTYVARGDPVKRTSFSRLEVTFTTAGEKMKCQRAPNTSIEDMPRPALGNRSRTQAAFAGSNGPNQPAPLWSPHNRCTVLNKHVKPVWQTRFILWVLWPLNSPSGAQSKEGLHDMKLLCLDLNSMDYLSMSDSNNIVDLMRGIWCHFKERHLWSLQGNNETSALKGSLDAKFTFQVVWT